MQDKSGLSRAAYVHTGLHHIDDPHYAIRVCQSVRFVTRGCQFMLSTQCCNSTRIDSTPGQSSLKLPGLACKAWFKFLNASSSTPQRTASNLSLQMPALLPKLSEYALMPSSPSRRRRQRLVICAAALLVSGVGTSLIPAPSKSHATDMAEVNDPDVTMSATKAGPLSMSSDWKELLLLACLAWYALLAPADVYWTAEPTLQMSDTLRRLITSLMMIFFSLQQYQVRRNQVPTAMLGPTTAATTPHAVPSLLSAVAHHARLQFLCRLCYSMSCPAHTDTNRDTNREVCRTQSTLKALRLHLQEARPHA